MNLLIFCHIDERRYLYVRGDFKGMIEKSCIVYRFFASL